MNFEQTLQESDELLLWAALSCDACSSSEDINHKSSLTIRNWIKDSQHQLGVVRAPDMARLVKPILRK